jgi:hypothetical protein
VWGHKGQQVIVGHSTYCDRQTSKRYLLGDEQTISFDINTQTDT